MTQHRRTAMATLLPLVLAGCGEWVHPEKSRDFRREDATCLQEAIKAVQYKQQKEDAPKWMERALGTNSYLIDTNESSRGRWHQSCLRLNGWVWRSTASRPSVANTDLSAPPTGSSVDDEDAPPGSVAGSSALAMTQSRPAPDGAAAQRPVAGKPLGA